MLSGLKPRSTVCSLTKLRISSPAPEQHQRQRHLDDHQRVAQPPAAEAAADALAGVLQRLDEVPPRRLQRRREAEQQRGHDGDRQAEQQHRQVQPDHRFAAGSGPSGMSATSALMPA